MWADGPGQALIRFDEYELDLAAIELRRDGQAVSVEPQVFDVLSYLFAERGRVVPKTELLDMIRTAHGRGYHFVGKVPHPPIEESAEPVTPSSTTVHHDGLTNEGRGLTLEGAVELALEPAG